MGRRRLRSAGKREGSLPALPPAGLVDGAARRQSLLLPARGQRFLRGAHRARHHHLHLLFLGGESLLRHEPTAHRRPGDLHRREAVDVEDPARRWTAGDQRAPRPGRPRGPPDPDLRRRHPRLFRAGFPHEEGRGARPLLDSLVRGDPARPLPRLLRAVLRHEALRNDRLGRGHGSPRVPELARRRDGQRVARFGRREALRAARVQHLPPAGLARPRAEPRGSIRKEGEAPGRPDHCCRRELHPRVDRDAEREDRRRLPADHADLSRPDQRRGASPARRLHQVALEGGAVAGGNPAAGEGIRSGTGGAEMSSAVVAPPPAQHPVEPRVHYLNARYGVKSWLLTRDHKRIALLYLASITFFFFLGGLFAFMIRLELLTPAGDVMTADTYNKMFTMHGVVMVFFFLIPSIPAVLGNFLLPMMIGARDLAFPRINLLSWYIYVLGALFTLWAVVHGGVDTGWTFYTPYSTVSSNTHVIATAVGIFITGFSSILTGLNFIVTIHTMRAPGLTWFRLPLFIWSNYAASLIMVLGTPVIAVTLLLVLLERLFHIGIFDPALGGDPVLFQ